MGLPELAARVVRLLLSPATEWDAIVGEPADARALYLNHALPLVLTAALAAALGMTIVGVGGQTVRIGYALTAVLVWVLLQLAAVYLFAFALNALAPRFGAGRNMGNALKTAIYAPTASWVAGLLLVVPSLSVLVFLGSIYSLYLLHVGLPKLMGPAPDKATSYSVTAIGVAIILYTGVEIVSGSAMPAVTPMMR